MTMIVNVANVILASFTEDSRKEFLELVLCQCETKQSLNTKKSKVVARIRDKIWHICKIWTYFV